MLPVHGLRSYFVQGPLLTGKDLLSSSHILTPLCSLPFPQLHICIWGAIFTRSTEVAYAPALSGIASVTQILHWCSLGQARFPHQTLNQGNPHAQSHHTNRINVNGLDRVFPMKQVSLLEMFSNENYLGEFQDAKLQRTILNFIKEFKKFKEDMDNKKFKA